MGEDSAAIRREIDATRARMDETAGALAYKADVPARVRDAVNERISTVKGTMSRVGDRAREANRRAARGASRGASMMSENPLGVALGALALGFVAGLLVPMSEAERGRIEPVREELIQRAGRVADEAIAAGRDLADVLSETAEPERPEDRS